MGTKNIANPTETTIYVGGKMIPPGESRDIDVLYLPAEHQDPLPAVVDQAPSLDALLREELKKSVKVLVESLPGLTQEALERMDLLESESETPRSTLLSAIKAEQMRRASDALEAEKQAALDAALQAHADRLYQKQLTELTEEERVAVHEAAATPKE